MKWMQERGNRHWWSGAMLLALLVVTGCAPGSGGDAIRGEEEAVLTEAPNVPPPITRNYATKVIVKLETSELVMPIAVMSAALAEASTIALPVTARTDSQITSGSCSTQPGCGYIWGNSCCALATTTVS